MAHSDRGFRVLAREEPDTILRLVQVLVPGMLSLGARVTPEMVDDPHLDAPPPALDADWVARVEPDDVLHVECQGYRDTAFPSRLFRYHLSLALRYPQRRVRTVALWLLLPPAQQRLDCIEIGDVRVRVTSIVLSEVDATLLLADPLTACFAPGADIGPMASSELCREVAEILAREGASWAKRHMAAIAAARRGRYKEMVEAMDQMGLGPVIIEDLVDFGHEQGLEKGLGKGLEKGREEGLRYARDTLLAVLNDRGLRLDERHQGLIEGERSLERFRRWLQRALRAGNVDDVFA